MCHPEFAKVLVRNSGIGTNIDNLEESISFFPAQPCQLGNSTSCDQCFAKSDLIRDKNAALPMTVEVINALNRSLLEILKAAHDLRFNFIEPVRHISH